MAEFSRLVITNKGQALLAKMMTGEGNVEFTKISTSDMEYTLEQLEALTEFSGVKQTVSVSKVTRTNGVAVTIEAIFNNLELTQGYHMRALGLYAIDPDDGEILYAVTTEMSGCCYMPAYNGVTVSGACIKLVTTVGNAENVSLEADPGVYATVGEIKELRESVDGIETWKDNTQKRLDNWGPTIVGHGQVINSLRDSIGNLKPVATSGDYDDLVNKPSIPAAVRVKGNAESTYRTGDVNLTAENIGALPISGGTVTGDLTVTGIIDGKIDYYQGRIGNLYTSEIVFNKTRRNTGISFEDYYEGENDDYTSDKITIYTTSSDSVCSSSITLKGHGTYGSYNSDETYSSEGYVSISGETVNVMAKKDFYFRAGDNVGSFYRGIRLNEASLYPVTDAKVLLGRGYSKWGDIYAANGTIQTSDRNQKNAIEELTAEKAKHFIYGLKPSTYKMNTGTSGRTHWGIISQDIEELFEEIGMTSLDFAGFIKSPKIQRITEDENGKELQKPIEKVIEGEYDYSLRYDEFIAPIIKVIQSQHEEIETLKQETQMLKQQMQQLMNKES